MAPFRQLVWALGDAVEDSLTASRGSSGEEWWSEELPHLSFQEGGCSAVTQRHREQRMFAYWKSQAEFFGPENNILTVCCDKSRVGRRDINLLAALLPDGRATWLPPQVPRVETDRRSNRLPFGSNRHSNGMGVRF